MFKLNNIQYWVLVIVCAAIGTAILLKQAHIKEEIRRLIYAKSAQASSYSSTADYTVDLDNPPPPPPPEIYEVSVSMSSALKIESTELIQSSDKLRLFIKVLIDEINKQEQFINIAQKKAPTQASLSEIFAIQKNIDLASARLAAIQILKKYNGYAEFSTAEKAYLLHHIEYKASDDLAVINYANGVRRYYLTLMHRAV
jgi:hypothetical protein